MAKKSKGVISKMLDPLFEKTKEGIGVLFKYFYINSSNVLLTIRDVREKSKDLDGVSVLRSKQYKEYSKQVFTKNLFDAKLRYNVILKLDKKNFKALCGIGFIALKKKHYTTAIEYFKNAFLISTSESEKLEAEAYLIQAITESNNSNI